jgi:hypothetical protein
MVEEDEEEETNFRGRRPREGGSVRTGACVACRFSMVEHSLMILIRALSLPAVNTTAMMQRGILVSEFSSSERQKKIGDGGTTYSSETAASVVFFRAVRTALFPRRIATISVAAIDE